MGTTIMHGAKPGQVSPGDTTTTDKAQATLIAQLAMKGHAVHKGGAGDFTVSKQGLSRYCLNLAELQAFAKQVGAAS